jgi:hypothetical protein
VEECGKVKTWCKWELTILVGLVILLGSKVATLLDREAEQKLFDNRYDVPESVRPHLVEPDPAKGRKLNGYLS